MNFKKSFIFVVLFAILYSPVKSFAFPNPSIQFNRIVGEGNVPFTITGENFNIPAGDEGYFCIDNRWRNKCCVTCGSVFISGS